MKQAIKTRLVLACTIALCLAAPALAETSTERSQLDSRIQVIKHNGDIIRLVTAEGVATTIELDKTETIKNFAMGDREAWKAKYDGNLFLLKPQAPKGSTNLTIYTSKRAYLFSVVMLKKETSAVAYWLKVDSPEESKSSPQNVILAQRKAERKQIAADFKDVPYQGNVNHDYWIVGPSVLQPVAAHDNGTFTYLTFSAANPLPAPFILEPDGSESLVEFHMEDNNIMVLHRVVEKILLRRGQQVAGITNKSSHRLGLLTPTGTTSDRVERVIPVEGDE